VTPGGQLPGVITGTEPTTANPRYTASTAAALSTSDLMSVARQVASEADDPSATEVAGVRTSVGMMSASIAPGLETSSASPVASYNSAEVEWVELHGSFTLSAAVPRGQALPSGTVLDIAINSHTGHIEIIALTHTDKTTQMMNLGTITR
jgi:hypothetical protein